MLRFKGIQHNGKVMENWSEPGWTGSRGDITRALMAVVIVNRHEKDVDFEFRTHVSDVNVPDGTVTFNSPLSDRTTRPFDLVVGSDGAGSVVREAMLQQVEGFTTETRSIPTYVTMIELDQVGDQLDKNYLHALSIRHFYAAGAINGDHGTESPRWFCAVGSKEELSFSSADEARALFARNCPRILELTSDDAVDAFARRPCYHVGRSLTCSQLHGGRAVLIGDAAGPFPPIGQGVNAAMESATVLDMCIGERVNDLPAAAARFDETWRPEVHAVSWISQRFLFDDPINTLRSMLTMVLGVNIADQAKSAQMSYAEVRRQAEKRGRLWR